ncbi:uncharacterized protein BX663DRAFT_496156 [Cokeromyces recurvatus]|uniref:uncharacterized protein n=1 Tax=Cokeromyces recurvatus TaxID=90255 RepID=UPI0022212494|nr:uncharacterized protein BX663DRAFT_496156 [Cokeromyces recurvatus]KAI7906365.1 hypothetical protein BX663DRAFT_496156 [Cokeromyces recurvatus]
MCTYVNLWHLSKKKIRHYSSEINEPPPFPSTNALKVDTTLSTKKQIYSPIYANLHTNLPHSVMSFQDVPFPPGTPFFPSHNLVLDYLNQLSIKENLVSWIRFSTLVKRVEFENDHWKVSSESCGDKKDGVCTTVEEFDAVVVATGHYTVPYIPNIPGLTELYENKRIQLLHSRDYRRPEDFKDKTILVVGGGSSAIDIVRETSQVAKRIYQSIRTETELARQAVEQYPPHTVHQVGLIERIVHTKVSSWIELSTQESLKDVDIIIFGTGYLYSFPFLPFQEGNLIKTGQTVHHLDHFMFYQKNPTLCFLGLPIRIVPFPLMQRQSIVMARYWSGKIPMLPANDNRTHDDDDSRIDFIMGVAREFEYNERLGAWAEGIMDPKQFEQWHSNHPLTGRLSEQWKELRKNALKLRKDYLGY